MGDRVTITIDGIRVPVLHISAVSTPASYSVTTGGHPETVRHYGLVSIKGKLQTLLLDGLDGNN